MVLMHFFLILSMVKATAHSPPASAEFVEKLWVQYEAIHGALANDDLDGARKEGTLLSKYFNNGPGEKAHLTFPEVRRRAHRIGKAKDIQHARYEFRQLTSKFRKTMRDIGHESQKRLHVYSCSEALDGLGGLWIQSASIPSNPYGCDSKQCISKPDDI